MRVQASGPSGSHSVADEHRLEELFRKLDVNRDGRIDIHDLSEALLRLKVPQLPGHAQVCSGLPRNSKSPSLKFGVVFRLLLIQRRSSTSAKMVTKLFRQAFKLL